MHDVTNQSPTVNGKRCEPKAVVPGFEDVFEPWACPECGANLTGGQGGRHMICLNACHLSADSRRRFLDGMAK